jgi:hypothetical protein
MAGTFRAAAVLPREPIIMQAMTDDLLRRLAPITIVQEPSRGARKPPLIQIIRLKADALQMRHAPVAPQNPASFV